MLNNQAFSDRRPEPLPAARNSQAASLGHRHQSDLGPFFILCPSAIVKFFGSFTAADFTHCCSGPKPCNVLCFTPPTWISNSILPVLGRGGGFSSSSYTVLHKYTQYFRVFSPLPSPSIPTSTPSGQGGCAADKLCGSDVFPSCCWSSLPCGCSRLIPWHCGFWGGPPRPGRPDFLPEQSHEHFQGF